MDILLRAHTRTTSFFCRKMRLSRCTMESENCVRQEWKRCKVRGIKRVLFEWCIWKKIRALCRAFRLVTEKLAKVARIRLACSAFGVEPLSTMLCAIHHPLTCWDTADAAIETSMDPCNHFEANSTARRTHSSRIWMEHTRTDWWVCGSVAKVAADRKPSVRL